VNRKIKRGSVALAASALGDRAGTGKKITACFVDGYRADIRVVVEAPLNTVSMVGVGIDVQDTCTVFFLHVSDGDRAVIVDTETGCLAAETVMKATAKIDSPSGTA